MDLKNAYILFFSSNFKVERSYRDNHGLGYPARLEGPPEEWAGLG